MKTPPTTPAAHTPCQWLYRNLMKDFGCYTVGHYTSSGKWEPESDYDKQSDAVARVRVLNGQDNSALLAENAKLREALGAALCYMDENSDDEQERIDYADARKALSPH